MVENTGVVESTGTETQEVLDEDIVGPRTTGIIGGPVRPPSVKLGIGCLTNVPSRAIPLISAQ